MARMKFSTPQGSLRSMCFPLLVVPMQRYSSGTRHQSMSSLYFSIRSLPVMAHSAGEPREQNSCSDASNSKRPRTKLVAQPPGMLCCSSTSTFFPAVARLTAADSPAVPEPITTASNLLICIPPF